MNNRNSLLALAPGWTDEQAASYARLTEEQNEGAKYAPPYYTWNGAAYCPECARQMKVRDGLTIAQDSHLAGIDFSREHAAAVDYFESHEEAPTCDVCRTSIDVALSS